MKAIFCTTALAFVVCLVIGPKSLLQISAWGMMFVEYSEDASVGSALKDTFSGERPCNMCVSLAQTPVENPEADLGRNILLKNLNVLLPHNEEDLWLEDRVRRIRFFDNRF